MGEIAKAQGAVRQDGGTDFKALLERCAPQFRAVMPKAMTPERMIQIGAAAYKQTPKLSECSTASVLSCIMTACALGVEPSAVDGMGNCYVIPRKNGRTGRMEAQFLLGKNGMVELALRSGNVKAIRTQCVYQGDTFWMRDGQSGLEWGFEPDLTASHADSDLELVYLTAELADGTRAFDYMTRAEVDAVKGRSQAKTGPWVTDYAAMAEKSVIRHAFNRRVLPVTAAAQRAISADGTVPVAVDERGDAVPGGLVDVDPVTGELTEGGAR